MQYINEVTDQDGWTNWHLSGYEPSGDKRNKTSSTNKSGVKPKKSKVALRWIVPQQEPRQDQKVNQVPARQFEPDKENVHTPLKRTLSPVYGAYRNELFDPHSQRLSAWVLHYSLTIVFPMFVHRPDVLKHVLSDRLEWFSKWPTLFHSYHFVAAAHYDMMSNRLQRYNEPQMIWHKAEAIRHLNSMISNLDSANLEIIIVSILYLDYGEVSDECFTRNVLEEPFDPPLPPKSWMLEEWNRVRPVEAHSKAIYQLVKMAGGLRCLKLCALRETLSRWDLRRASIMAQAPQLACLQALDEEILRECLLMLQDTTSAPGAGFTNSIPGGLPPPLLSCVLMLAAVNRLMFDPEAYPTPRHFLLRNARTILQHRLLSLPSWDTLPTAQRKSSQRLTYECCRLTAILYSNGVLLGIPPLAGWIDPITSQIRQVVQSVDPEQDDDRLRDLLTWTYVLACIASYHTKNYEFFERRLCRHLSRSGLTSWDAVVAILITFLWSTSACERSAAALRDRVTTRAA